MDNLQRLAKKSQVWKKVIADVKAVEEIFSISLEPKTDEEKRHKSLTSKIFSQIASSKNPTRQIEQAALLRKSLG